jgi:hypothetical protein
MTLRRWLYARPGSSDDSGAPLVRHPANGVRGVRAQMRRRPERPYSKRIVQNRPFLRQLRTSASTTDQLSRNPGTLDLASAALDELKARPTGARRVLKWPRQAIHPCSKRTTQSGNRGWRLLITRQAGCCTRPELLVCGGAPRRIRTGDPILTIDAPVVHEAMQPSPTHATAQVRGASEGWVVGRREVTCSAVSGKSLARAPASWSRYKGRRHRPGSL